MTTGNGVTSVYWRNRPKSALRLRLPSQVFESSHLSFCNFGLGWGRGCQDKLSLHWWSFTGWGFLSHVEMQKPSGDIMDDYAATIALCMKLPSYSSRALWKMCWINAWARWDPDKPWGRISVRPRMRSPNLETHSDCCPTSLDRHIRHQIRGRRRF
jgi:hypothetical protein